MRVIAWLRDLVFGQNGYDAEEQDEEIQLIKDESQSCVDKASTHFGEMGQEFTKFHRKSDSTGESS